MVPRQFLFIFLIFCLLASLINCKTDCSCTCCNGNRCIQRYQGTVSLPTCSHNTCKHACKLRYPGQCGRSPGSLTARCTKTKTAHRSPMKKIKDNLKPTHRRPY